VTDSSQYNLPKVSRHAFTYFAFEPVTSTNQISSAKTASKASAEMQPLADSNKNASSFDNKPSSTFQLVVASVDWKSKALSNLGYNQHESSCASLLAACAKCINSHKSSCASLLAARAHLLFHRLIASHAFAREEEDVVVASSRAEKDVAVDCLFWRILQCCRHHSIIALPLSTGVGSITTIATASTSKATSAAASTSASRTASILGEFGLGLIDPILVNRLGAFRDAMIGITANETSINAMFLWNIPLI
jgi:hypothetical protein